MCIVKEAPEKLNSFIREHVVADLDPPIILVNLKVAVSCIVGGLLSLAICGQFGFALTISAQSLSSFMHENMHPVLCAVICGGLYAIFPVAILRLLLTNPLEFKAIMRFRTLTVLFWFFGLGGVLSFWGHHGNDLLSLILWTVGAIIVAHALAAVSHRLLPVWTLKIGRF